MRTQKVKPDQTLPTKKVIYIPPIEKKEEAVQRQLRVVAYCRVSTASEAQEESLKNQQEYYTKKIEENPKWKLAGIFSDDGISGTDNKNRKQFNKMIELCEAGKIDLVITKSVSRFFRNTAKTLQYVHLLRSLEIPILFEKENINAVYPESDSMITFYGMQAQGESESLSRNIKWGIKRGYEAGKYSYAYKNWYAYRQGEDSRPEIIPEEAAVITRIYKSFLLGDSLQLIKDSLESDGIPAPKSNKWSKATIRNLLRDEKNCGNVLRQKTYITDPILKKVKVNNGELPKYLIEGAHVPIISPDVYDAAQKEFTKRNDKESESSNAKTGLAKYSKYALTGIVVCAQCGTAYRRITWSKKGKKKVVWRCINRVEHGKKYCDSSPSIKEEQLKSAIAAAINSRFDHPDHLEELLMESLGNAVLNIEEGELGRLNIRRKQLDDLFNSMLNTATQIDDAVFFSEKIQEICSELERIDEMIATLPPEEKVESDNSGQLRLMKEALQKESKEIPYDDCYVRQLIDRVKIVDAENIVVYFKDGREVEQVLE